MPNQLFLEIDKFDLWARSQFNKPQDDIGGEWECEYAHWNDIYTTFQAFLQTADPLKLTATEKDRLLYIIARDNEQEEIAGLLDGNFLIVLAEYAVLNGHRDDKWQLATQLYKLPEKEKALTLLEQFVQDEDEYVNRRALLELARLQSDKTEGYAVQFWHKDKYGDLEEYQKIAALHALHLVRSALLGRYIDLAKQSGQPYLTYNANQIEHEKKGA